MLSSELLDVSESFELLSGVSGQVLELILVTTENDDTTESKVISLLTFAEK